MTLEEERKQTLTPVQNVYLLTISNSEHSYALHIKKNITRCVCNIDRTLSSKLYLSKG